MELFTVRDIMDRQCDIATATGKEPLKAWVSKDCMIRLFGHAVAKYKGVVFVNNLRIGIDNSIPLSGIRFDTVMGYDWIGCPPQNPKSATHA